MNRWALFLLLLLAPILWSIPTYIGYWSSDQSGSEDRVFLGWIRADDYHRYGSFIDQTRYQNRLMYWDYSAIEPQSPRMIAIYFFCLGIIGKLTNWPAEHLWLVSHYLSGAWFVFVLIKFLNGWKNDRKFTATASILVIFSSGIELFAHFINIGFPREKNFWMDGFSTFCTFHNPLKIAGIALVIMLLSTWRDYLAFGKRKHLFLAGLLIIMLWAVHPNSALPGFFALLATACIRSDMKEKRWPNWDNFIKLIPLLFPMALIGLYILWMKSDQTTANIIRQYSIRDMVEPFRYYPIRYGLILPLGVMGIMAFRRLNDSTAVMLAGWWIGAEIFSHYSGMSGLLFQHMIHLPMAVFAANALIKLRNIAPRTGWTLSSLVIVILVLQNSFILGTVISQTRDDVWPTSLYWTKGERDAARMLRTLAEGNVLVSRNSGNKVGWLSLHPVFLGHWGTTPDKGKKEIGLKEFFNPRTSTAWRLDFLKKYRIRYLWYGPHERNLGPVDPNLPLHVLIENEAVSVFENRLILTPVNSRIE